MNEDSSIDFVFKEGKAKGVMFACDSDSLVCDIIEGRSIEEKKSSVERCVESGGRRALRSSVRCR